MSRSLFQLIGPEVGGSTAELRKETVLSQFIDTPCVKGQSLSKTALDFCYNPLHCTARHAIRQAPILVVTALVTTHSTPLQTHSIRALPSLPRGGLGCKRSRNRRGHCVDSAAERSGPVPAARHDHFTAHRDWPVAKRDRRSSCNLRGTIAFANTASPTRWSQWILRSDARGRSTGAQAVEDTLATPSELKGASRGVIVALHIEYDDATDRAPVVLACCLEVDALAPQQRCGCNRQGYPEHVGTKLSIRGEYVQVYENGTARQYRL